jgi:HK97 family phage portal protein
MAFVSSGGSLQSLGRLETPHNPRMLLGGFAFDYLEIWRRQYAVRTTISFLGRNIAQLGLHTFRRKGDDDRQRISDHPLAQLIRQPNPWTTRYRFLDALVHDLAIFDQSFWVKSKIEGRLSLMRLFPPAVTMRGNAVYPELFEYRGLSGMHQYKAADVVFFRGYSGGYSDIGGVPPMESLRDVLEESFYASQSRSQIMRNGARTSGYITRPPEAKWSDTARGRFKTEWQAQYAGNGPQAGGTPILEDGMTFVPAALTPKDLQYIEARKLTREEVAAAYFIPPPMIGLLENATFANIVEQHVMLYQDTIGPWLSMIQDEIALQLIPDMPDPENVYVEFNLAEKMRGSFEKRQAAIQSAVGGPTMTTNEGRALDNLPPLPGGDELIKPLNVTQPGDQNPIPAETDDNEPTITPKPPNPPPADDLEKALASLRNGHQLARSI